MSEAEFTPGAWIVGSGDDYFVMSRHYPKTFPHKFSSDDTGPYIAWIGNRTEDFGLANAHLIAAAPELYGALLHLVKVIEMAFPSLDNTQSVKSAFSALAKARGETP